MSDEGGSAPVWEAPVWASTAQKGKDSAWWLRSGSGTELGWSEAGQGLTVVAGGLCAGALGGGQACDRSPYPFGAYRQDRYVRTAITVVQNSPASGEGCVQKSMIRIPSAAVPHTADRQPRSDRFAPEFR